MQEQFEIIKTCVSCDNCRLLCPENSVVTNGKDYAIDPWSCTQCGICLEVCPSDSIKTLTLQN